VQVVRRALQRASPAVPVVLHLPRLETWAVHSVCASASADDSQADATSPAAVQEATEQGLGHAGRSPYGCGPRPARHSRCHISHLCDAVSLRHGCLISSWAVSDCQP